MPTFSYTAKSLKGETTEAVREAENEKELAKILRQEGFILIKAGPLKKSKFKKEISFPFLGGVSLKEKIMFTRNLQVMVSAGLGLARALNTLASQSQNKRLKNVLLGVREGIIGGKSFSAGIHQYSNVFSDFYYHLVKVGEESGTLEKSLGEITAHLEKEYALRSNIRGALMYPAVIILAMIGILILMLLVVIPKLAETFIQMNIELPFTTKLIMGASLFLAERWYLVILIIFCLVFLIGILLKTKIGNKIIDYLFLQLPIFAPLIKKSNSAYAIRTLATLMDAGLPILQSLNIISDALGNFYFKKSIIEAGQKVKAGKNLSESLEFFANLYSPMVLQMIGVGEQTGQTSNILKKTADFLEEEVTKTTQNLASVIEPIIILLVGGAVGFLAVSIIQPIYQMTGAM
ncbi:MAG: hypothetical protein CO031_02880 [Candidatus Nealsonbacteria bacterium CG_4_9_14_0_2_um_filter_37_38]|uniref:Type II secretion system protein GspF domain-containing protein n=1 Tax=Candidatus Nealsonbacteria bacterium CG_4_10_14_0_8_um_filter_37_14 TaxID=1974684 RepID=A0A2M7R5D6_9BACT|nr:MAG: hypothetical protein COV63_00665 [Candidatus Nealsonbacteria bacterium CG11_big_fil_rev_8_21_14_0_20_37_68]PIW92236.1 MAG: hypothetical protein COZ89_01025 [Candidatus Nealsonbacteria bacterium CG_4_8_14_3_um_filter_37_23]PIY88515.1 MAG: hypothetical protein COY73_03530 [Candidatus Nealsonbacteria bacterium CG_4_10_14_0_8_um_filter_37_14]PJC51404.1 MAG: hypothetical protein CO031_02880 [Candidatus Nealsonbacteria bacterium CG_4_9_14_0_2_um_filter_37_38]